MNPEEPTNQPNPVDPIQPVQPSEPPEAAPQPVQAVPSSPWAAAPADPNPPVTPPGIPVNPAPMAPQPVMPTPAAKSSNKLLIILISVIGGLIVIAGIVLAIVLLSAKKEDAPIDDNSNSTSVVKPSESDKEKDPVVIADGKDLTCKVADVGGEPIDMTMTVYFDKNEVATEVVYEYAITDASIELTEEMLTYMKNELESELDAQNFVIEAKLVSSSKAQLTVTDKDGGKLNASALGYDGNDYSSLKKSFESECAGYDGTFSGLKNIAE